MGVLSKMEQGSNSCHGEQVHFLERITEWGIRELCGVLLPEGINLKVINGGRHAETFLVGARYSLGISE